MGDNNSICLIGLWGGLNEIIPIIKLKLWKYAWHITLNTTWYQKTKTQIVLPLSLFPHLSHKSVSLSGFWMGSCSGIPLRPRVRIPLSQLQLSHLESQGHKRGCLIRGWRGWRWSGEAFSILPGSCKCTSVTLCIIYDIGHCLPLWFLKG